MPSLVRIQHPPPSVKRAQRRMPITRSERLVRGPAQPRIRLQGAAPRPFRAGQGAGVRALGTSRSVLEHVRGVSGQPSALVSAGVAQLVERQPSKLNVASSNLVSRSRLSSRGRPNPRCLISRGRPNPRGLISRGRPNPRCLISRGRFGACGMNVCFASRVPSGSRAPSAHLAQLVEHVLGKDEVISSILMVGSNRTSRAGGGFARRMAAPGRRMAARVRGARPAAGLARCS